MSEKFLQNPTTYRGALVTLFPSIAVVFVAYLVIGIAMPVLPLHVHQDLGLGAFVVGLVAGSQFIASLLTRMWAGHYADSRGPKRAVIVGLLCAVASGLFYVASLPLERTPVLAVITIVIGRGILGAAESFMVTGALSWGLALLGHHNTGKVMSWVGTALYAAFAIGAPVGSSLYAVHGFLAVAVASVLLPAAALPLVLSFKAVRPTAHTRASLGQVLRAVWLPGVGLALSGVGFGAITTFVVLLFVSHGWGLAWLALTLFSSAFIGGRIFFGHWPDRGGARVALVCILVETLGLAIVWLATSGAVAFVGVILTGFGYALVYPALGVEALRRAPTESRGLAMGTYTAFLDLSLAISGPTLGLVAASNGLNAVYLVSALVVFGSLIAALLLLRMRAATNAAALRRN